MAEEHNVTKKIYKTIIIGAGIAGLSAAKHLVKNKIMDFVILEAKERIGGRICHVKLGDIKVEIGANWIHGVLGNPMYEIAMAHNLINVVSTAKPHRVVAATEDGKQVPFSVLQEIYGAYMCFLHRCEEYFLCQYLPPEGIHSVGEHINLEIALYLDRISDPRQRHIRQLIFNCLLKRETCISGCDSMDEIDLVELGSYTELQGGNIVLPSGYSSILEPLSQDIPKTSILLSHKVSEVRWCGSSLEQNYTHSIVSESGNESDDSGKTVIDVNEKSNFNSSNSVLESNGKECTDHVEVHCDNGQVFQADNIICALPLGVLKETASKMFSPQLPQYKMDSIDRLLFGTVDKIFLVYERPFLNPDISEVLLLWETQKDKETVSNDDISKNWFKKIYSFSKVSETLLLGWVSGTEAMYMETLPENVIADTCTSILRKFLNDPFVPKPKLVYCSRWYSDKCTRGSYTAIAVGASQIDIENVAQPLYSEVKPSKPAIIFAGEHTHTNFYSTVHGAYLSGRTAAQLVLRSESEPQVVLECNDTSDLSSWIRGISLES